jgi:transcriptional regulator with XRE-family HTH domain
VFDIPGISQNYLATMERGKVEIGAEILLRISREFVKSVEWLMTGKSSFSNVALLSDLSQLLSDFSKREAEGLPIRHLQGRRTQPDVVPHEATLQ